ncbi:TetR/AcrR family transcriptional regulator [Arthrobacter sp. NEB 688]|uniref:TetR/AcrR family transcriptional regulator n=1 Tax=Arthrobacter sp. NEB 688 TaxID=904039 RepID=UPI0015672C21|nr:TetR/AcrR family transcriptional regulator [Arthrobacter sp. NEB 688]QKE82897.1 TetR/AcrR family transcriptional regulator [Arthrobacter sp. NEB 688]
MPRAPRRDAARNAERLREAAVRVFRASGTNAPLEEVAAAAGLSIGTLYNHFPGRDQLLAAILPAAADEQLRRIAAAVGEGTATDRLARYLTEVLAVQASDRLLSDALADPERLPPEAASSCEDVLTLGEGLLDEARAEDPSLLLDRETLRALVVTNALAQRAGTPPGWERLVHALATAHAAHG